MSYSDLPDGSHTLTVQVTDNASRVTTKSATWTIDAAAPVAQITSGPADGSSAAGTGATFEFSSNEAATFQCRIYQAALTPPAFAACSGTGSHSVSGLAPGTYAFEVLATDLVGNQGVPVKRTFTLSAPPVTSTTNPDGGTSPSSDAGTPTDTGSNGTTQKQAIAAKLATKFALKAGKTRVRLLKLSRLPAAAVIQVACKGKGCTFRSKSFKPKAGALDLTKAFKKSLGARTKLTITIGAPGMSGQQITLVTQKKKRPKRTTKPI
jgi:hypothetical protein